MITPPAGVPTAEGGVRETGGRYGAADTPAGAVGAEGADASAGDAVGAERADAPTGGGARGEDGSLVAEYGLLTIVGATIAGLALKWAAGGAIFDLFSAILVKARSLVGV